MLIWSDKNLKLWISNNPEELLCFFISSRLPKWADLSCKILQKGNRTNFCPKQCIICLPYPRRMRKCGFRTIYFMCRYFLKKRLKRGKILFIQVNVIFGLYIYSNSKNYIYMYWHIYPTCQKFSRFVSVAL